MTQWPDDGGPAFPESSPTNWANREAGMSLRDYFAGQAMQGMYACQDFMNELSREVRSKDDARAMIAKWAYLQADAMIAERQKPLEAFDNG